MSDETDRFVFDTYAEKPSIVYALEELPDGCVVVCDDALCKEVGGMPSGGDYVTVAAVPKTIRGRVLHLAYVIQPEP